VFKGLESVRSDWTPLAREVQRELYRRVFLDEPYEDYLRDIVARLSAGELDELLVYRKRLRRPLDTYVRNVPPHVQAARKLERHGRDIEYVITLNGPEPVEARHSALDYDHYIDRQLTPVADGILHFLGRRFEEIARAQLAMF
jgi:DNA polymerase-2